MNAAVSSSFNLAGPSNAGGRPTTFSALRGDTTGKATGSPLPAVTDSTAFIHLLQFFLSPREAAPALDPRAAHSASEGPYDVAGFTVSKSNVQTIGKTQPEVALKAGNALREFNSQANTLRFGERREQLLPVSSSPVADAIIREMLSVGRLSNPVASPSHTSSSDIDEAKGAFRQLKTEKDNDADIDTNVRESCSTLLTAVDLSISTPKAVSVAIDPSANNSASFKKGEQQRSGIGSSYSEARAGRRAGNNTSERNTSMNVDARHSSVESPIAFRALLKAHAEENANNVSEPGKENPATSTKLVLAPSAASAQHREANREHDSDRSLSVFDLPQSSSETVGAMFETQFPTSSTVPQDKTAPQELSARPEHPLERTDIKPPSSRVTSQKEISLRVEPAGSSRIDLQVSQRRGEIHVAVRAADATLTGNLQQQLPSLVDSLDRIGFSARTFTDAPVTHSANGSASFGADSSESSGENFSSFQGRSGDLAGSDARGRHQGRSQERAFMNWLEQVEA